MAVLLDTNILVRLADHHDPMHGVARSAVSTLEGRGGWLHTTPQVLIEFGSVATRPAAVNGLGLSQADADRLAAGFEPSGSRSTTPGSSPSAMPTRCRTR